MEKERQATITLPAKRVFSMDFAYLFDNSIDFTLQLPTIARTSKIDPHSVRCVCVCVLL